MPIMAVTRLPIIADVLVSVGVPAVLLVRSIGMTLCGDRAQVVGRRSVVGRRLADDLSQGEL